jgi:hypothetical protein
MPRSLTPVRRPLLAAALAALFAAAALAQDATGTVASRRGTTVTIRDVTGGEPQAGDRVTLWDEVPGIGPVALQGSWVVKSAAGGTVTAEAEGAAAGAPQVGQTAKIKTSGAKPKPPPKVSQATRDLFNALDGKDAPEPIVRLIVAGADVNHAQAGGWTPLMLASQNRSTDIVGALLAAGAKPNLQTPEGETALMLAVAAESGVAEALLRNGADPNLKTRAGKTALMVASERGVESMVELLLRFGADPAARDSASKSARDLAQDRGHEAIVRILRGPAAPRKEEWTLRESSKGEVSASLPVRYEAIATKDPATRLFLATPQQPGGWQRVFKVATSPRGTETLEQSRSRLLDVAAKRFEQFKATGKGDGKVGGDPALWFAYTYVWQNVPVTAIAYVVIRGDSAHQITFATHESDYEAARKEFGGILASVRLR